jgi:nitronate monooxygenase
MRRCWQVDPSNFTFVHAMNHTITPNQLATLLGIRTPILQAPMGRSAPPALAAAVSNAGCLGMLGCSWDTAELMQRKIRETKQLTSKPFAVNLCMQWDQAERLSIALAEGVRHISLFWGSPSPLMAKAKAAGAIVLHTVGDAQEAQHALELGVDVLVAQGVEAGGHVRSKIALSVLVPRVCDVVASLNVSVPVIAAGGMADGRGIAAAIALGASGV